jgi:hypothetical protein
MGRVFTSDDCLKLSSLLSEGSLCGSQLRLRF